MAFCCGPCQNRPRCRYAAFGATNTRNHGMSSLQRDRGPKQHVSAGNPTANVCCCGRLRDSFHPTSPSHLHSLWRAAVYSLPQQLPYHNESPAHSDHSLLYCLQQHARDFIWVQLAQSIPNNSHQATIVRQPGIARAHGPCFIVPNGAWTICNSRLVPASGRNTSLNPGARQCHRNRLAPNSGTSCNLSKPVAFHFCAPACYAGTTAS